MAFTRIAYQFLQDPDDALKCSICREIARGQPMQHGGGCGRLFCKECISKYGSKPCPMCRGKKPQYFPDSRSLRDIKCLGVRCDNVDRGCEWTGTVGTLEDHVAECGYTLVECTNKCSIKQKTFCLMRKDLDNHVMSECPLRAYKCKFCGKEGTYHSITGEHNLHCLKKPIPCPNTDCTLTIDRGGVEEHVASECEHTIVACKYSNIGCPERKKRKIMTTHETDDTFHLRVSLNKISQLDGTVSQLQVVVKELATKQGNIVSIPVNVPNFSSKMKSGENFISEPFFTIPNGYKMQLLVCCSGLSDGKGTHVSVFTELLDVPYKNQLQWPFRGSVTIELVNQVEVNNHHRMTYNYSDDKCARPGGGGLGYSLFIPLSSLGILQEHRLGSWVVPVRTKFVVNDTLHFRVTVQEASNEQAKEVN